MENTRITVAKLKVAKFMSEETLCFEATILLDGKPFATASNEGHGGMTFIRPLQMARQQFDEAVAFAKSLPDVVTDLDEEGGGKFTYKRDLENLVDDLVSAMLFRKDMEASCKRLMKKAVVFIKDGKVWTSKPKDPRHLQNPNFIGLVRKQHPQVVILNELPIAQAVDAYIAASA